MMSSMITAWLLAALFPPGQAPPASPLLEPSGKWVVDYEEGMCVLSRRYGEGDGAVQIGFRPVPFVEKMQMVLLASSNGGGTHFGKAAIGLDDAPTKQEPYGSFSLGSPAQRVVTITTDANLLTTMENATTLSIVAERTAWRLRLRSAAAAVKALGTCQDQLLGRWGLDPAKLHAESAHVRVEGGDARWFRNDDYPPAALRSNAQGRTVAVMAIDAQGKPTNCRVVESAKNADLDGVTCRIGMGRVPFTPARDHDGAPTASWYVMAVRWIIPTR